MSIAWQTVQDALVAWVRAATGLSNVLWTGQNAQRPSAPYIAMRIMGVRQLGHDAPDVEENPLEFNDLAVASVNAGTNEITFAAAHNLLTGDGPVRFTTTGAWAGVVGGDEEIDFWVIKVSATVIKIAESFPDAMNGAAFDIAGAGTGTHTLSDTDDTRRQGSEILLYARGMREVTLALQCFGGSAAGSSSAMALLNAVVGYAELETQRAAFHAAGIGMARFDRVRSLDGMLGATVYESRAILECTFFLAEEVSEQTTYIDYVELENETTETTTFVPEDPNP